MKETSSTSEKLNYSALGYFLSVVEMSIILTHFYHGRVAKVIM